MPHTSDHTCECEHESHFDDTATPGLAPRRASEPRFDLETQRLPKERLVFLWKHENPNATPDDDGWVLAGIRMDNVVVELTSTEDCKRLTEMFR